jgi:hypothetical protein
MIRCGTCSRTFQVKPFGDGTETCFHCLAVASVSQKASPAQELAKYLEEVAPMEDDVEYWTPSHSPLTKYLRQFNE